MQRYSELLVHGSCSDNDQATREHLVSQREPKAFFFDGSFDMETIKAPKYAYTGDLLIRLNGGRTHGFRCRRVSRRHG